MNIFPISEIISDSSGDWKKDRFKAKVNFSWIRDDGNAYPAPKSQLVLYPKYPEVRFSGFLAKCEKPPSDLMATRMPARILFLSPTNQGEIRGYVAAPNSIIAKQFANLNLEIEHGVFHIINLTQQVADNKIELIKELTRIHNLGWIDSKRLDKDGNTLDCNSSNCGGYTLEAELGITPNGYSAPDYLGWEIKQFGVKKFELTKSIAITLMTPEPTGGIYKDLGVDTFIRTYGYKDQNREDRLNFNGVHKIGEKQKKTHLTLKLIGFDEETGKIRNSNDQIALIDTNDVVAASWSFTSLLKHWNKKHNQACYIPSLSIVNPNNRQYKYSDKVLLGIGTDFQFFLKEMGKGGIYYDPGIKMEKASTKPKIKRRSQFRIKSRFLEELYKESEIIELKKEG